MAAFEGEQRGPAHAAAPPRLGPGQTRPLNPDAQLVRDWVTAADHLQYTTLPEGMVAVLVSHSNLATKMPDLRLMLSDTILRVKEKIYTHTGTPPGSQRLLLRSKEGRDIGELGDDSRMLGYYSVESGMEIHVIDTDPLSLSRNGGLEDTSLVQKYSMTEEEYDQREGTLRAWAREKRREDPNFRLGSVAPNGALSSNPRAAMRASAAATAAAAQDGSGGDGSGAANAGAPPPGPESVAGMEVGMRCEVQPGARRGQVMYVGEVQGLRGGGHWVGVRFDEPVGLSDGSAGGTRVFECEAGYGGFVRGRAVTVGDFPERDLLDELDTDDEDEEQEEQPGNEAQAQGATLAAAVDAAPATAAAAATTASNATMNHENDDENDDEDEF